MGVPLITGIDFGGPPRGPVLVVGPSLGTTVSAVWGAVAKRLTTRFRVIGWNLPGHGAAPMAGEGFTVADLSAGVLSFLDGIAVADTFHYAGTSIGGCVGLQLMLDSPDRVQTATLLSTGATVGKPGDWLARASLVRSKGTLVMRDASAKRWFAPTFADHDPLTASALLQSLVDTDAEAYALVCEAFASFDVTARLDEIATPVLCIAGVHDNATPVQSLRRIAYGVQNARLVVLSSAGHLAAAEEPAQVCDLIDRSILRPDHSFSTPAPTD